MYFKEKGKTRVPNFPGVYLGSVADNNDPTKNGRLKLYVPFVLYSEPSLWALPRQMSYGPQAGSINIPSLGSSVFVSFLDGDPSKPIWEPGHPNVASPIPDESKQDYPQTNVFKTLAGHVMTFMNKASSLGVNIASSSGHNLDLSDIKQKLSLTSAGAQSHVIDDVAQTMTQKTASVTHVLNGLTNEAHTIATKIALGNTFAGLDSTTSAILKQHLDTFQSNLLTQRLQDQIKLVTLLNGVGTMSGPQLIAALGTLVSGFLPGITVPSGSSVVRIEP